MAEVFSRGYKRLGLFVACFLVVVGLALVVVKLMLPTSGYIDIKYDGLSPSGAFWQVENRSTQTIYIQGNGERAWPGVARTECKRFDFSDGRSDERSDPYGLVDGFPSSIKLPPGARHRLNVDTTLLREYKGGRCRLRLELLGGTFVESEEFSPGIDMPSYIRAPHLVKISTWLRLHTEYRLATDADCHCDDNIRAVRQGHGTDWGAQPAFHPYYAVGDFDGDGFEDVAVVVIPENPGDKIQVVILFGSRPGGSDDEQMIPESGTSVANRGLFIGLAGCNSITINGRGVLLFGAFAAEADPVPVSPGQRTSKCLEK